MPYALFLHVVILLYLLLVLTVLGKDGEVMSFMEVMGEALKFHKTGTVNKMMRFYVLLTVCQ